MWGTVGLGWLIAWWGAREVLGLVGNRALRSALSTPKVGIL